MKIIIKRALLTLMVAIAPFLIPTVFYFLKWQESNALAMIITGIACFIIFCLVIYFFWPITRKKTANKILRDRNLSSAKYVWLSRYHLKIINRQNTDLRKVKSPKRFYIARGTDNYDVVQDIGNQNFLILKNKTERLE